jgi:hypothetical protein
LISKEIITDSDTNLSIGSWDIYHLMLGGSLNVLDLEFTLGLGYAFGKEQIKKQSQSPSLESSSTLTNTFGGANFSYRSFKFILGFAF